MYAAVIRGAEDRPVFSRAQDGPWRDIERGTEVSNAHVRAWITAHVATDGGRAVGVTVKHSRSDDARIVDHADERIVWVPGEVGDAFVDEGYYIDRNPPGTMGIELDGPYPTEDDATADAAEQLVCLGNENIDAWIDWREGVCSAHATYLVRMWVSAHLKWDTDLLDDEITRFEARTDWY